MSPADENVPVVVNIKTLKGRLMEHKFNTGWSVVVLKSVEKKKRVAGQFAVKLVKDLTETFFKTKKNDTLALCTVAAATPTRHVSAVSLALYPFQVCVFGECVYPHITTRVRMLQWCSWRHVPHHHIHLASVYYYMCG